MTYELDTERLRRDMEDDYGTAMSNGIPMAVMELPERRVHLTGNSFRWHRRKVI